jgi:iron complex outermembrane recepter protein
MKRSGKQKENFYGFSKLTCSMTREAAAVKASQPDNRSGNLVIKSEWRKAGLYLRLIVLSIGVVAAITATTGYAKDPPHAQRYEINIPSMNAADALNKLAEQTDTFLLFPYQIVKSRQSNAVTGRYTLMEALSILLEKSGLAGDLSSSGVLKFSLVESKAYNENEGQDMNLNKGNQTLFAGIAAFFTAAFGAGNVVAQEEESANFARNSVLEEIVVTAQKREERLIDVPMSISALSGETIENAGMQNIIDLSYAVPNLSVREEGPGQQTIIIRGMGNSWGSSSLVGLYLDEVPVSAVPEAQIDLQTLDLARVEVLKGPQGSLYGQGAVGGTIRFITQDPSFDGIEGKIGLSLYDTHKGDMSEEVTGVLNLPVVDDVLAFRAAGTYKNKGGWIDRPAIDDENFNDNELTNVRVKSLWQATDRLAIKALVIHHRNDAGGLNFANLGPYSASEVQVAVDPTLSQGVKDDYEVYNLTINYQFDFATLTSSTSYIDLDKVYFNRSQFVEIAGVGSLESAVSTSFEIEAFSQELRLSSHQEQRLSWTVGAFYNDLKIGRVIFDAHQALNGAPLPFIPLVADRTEQPESVAVFGDIAYALTGQLRVGVGSRYFEDTRKLTNHRNGVTFKDKFDDISSRLYVVYAVNDQANLYASVAEGFRSGGFNAVAGTAFPLAYKPDEVTSYEVGVKAGLFDRRLSAELSLYFSDYADMQGIVSSILTGEYATINGGDAEVKGVEWLLQWAVTDALSLGFSGNVTDAEVVGLPGSGITPDLNPGDPLHLVPEYNYSLTADYHFSWSAAVPGYVQLSYHRQGPTSFVSRLSGVLNPVSEADAIGFLNLQLGARFQKFDLQLFARNLLDEDRPTAPDLSNSRLTPQARPRTIGVNLTYQF